MQRLSRQHFFSALPLVLVLWFASFCASAQVPFPDLPQPMEVFSDEDKDWGVKPTSEVRSKEFHAPTPTRIPGGRVIRTLELKALLEQRTDTLVIDALYSEKRESIPGAFLFANIGERALRGKRQKRFAAALAQLAGGRKDRPMVFLCVSSECWLSYNAARNAIAAGFTDVIWYRGGTSAWEEADLPLKRPAEVDW